MPRINWDALPYAVREHLVKRLRKRRISIADLEALRAWIDGGPDLPDGDWYKDFGNFKLAGHGNRPSTFLEKAMMAKGKKVE
jgi:hypothetical protein